ncbi:MAG: MFS transporter [Candidatus Marinimicrobia bacterium]|nr:MFS transporter [Candidatus Neomarinimicrobiota bacterium]
MNAKQEKKIKGLRWWIVTLVAVATMINYIDRFAMAIMWPEMSEELGIGNAGYAKIMSMFLVAYGVSQMLSGKLYDIVGTRLGFVISIVVWSLSAALHGLARSVVSFSLVRFLLGVGEAGNWPGATKSNAEWFPAKERAFAQGIFSTGTSAGSIVAPPLIAILYLSIGWKITFMLLGLLGMLWIIPWWYLNRALPKDHPWITDEEKQHILGDQALSDTPASTERVPGWGELLTYKQSYSVIISRIFLDPVWWLFVVWLPIYLHNKFGFNVKEIGMYAWMPYVGAALGSLFGGYLSGYFMEKGWTVNKARKWAITLGAIIMFPSLIMTAFASTSAAAIALITIILFGFQISMNNIQTLPSDFFGGGTVGSLAGMGGLSAVLGVIVVTNLVPVIVDTSGYTLVFLMGAGLVPAALLFVFLFSGEIKKVQLKEPK